MNQPREKLAQDTLWNQTFSKLSNDKKFKDLVDSYKSLLNDNAQEGDKGYRDPSKQEVMRDIVEEKLSIMAKKQWILQWGKTPVVVREQAKKVIKIVQQFSGIGTAVAGLDPTHAGVA